MPLSGDPVRRSWTPSIRAVRTFVTVVAALYAVWNIGFVIGCGMLAGWTPLQLGSGNDAFVPATILPPIGQLESTSTASCSSGECPTIDTVMAVTVVPLWIRCVAALTLFVEVAGVLVALAASRRVLGLVSEGRPFDGAVPRALRLAALGLVGGTLLRSALTWPAFAAVITWVNQLGDDPARMEQHLGIVVSANPIYLNLPLLTTGLVVGCLVVAFREGARLQKDAEGVV